MRRDVLSKGVEEECNEQIFFGKYLIIMINYFRKKLINRTALS